VDGNQAAAKNGNCGRNSCYTSIQYKNIQYCRLMSSKIGIDQSHGFMQEIINNQFSRKSYQLEVEDLKV
jgi:hypothetical protein